MYYARVTATKMEYRVNFLVDGLYNIKMWRKDANIKKCYLQCAHTHTSTRDCASTNEPDSFKLSRHI